MTIGLVGRKCGMTRVFTEAGETLPVTVIEALPNRVVQVKAPVATATGRCRSPSAPAALPA